MEMDKDFAAGGEECPLKRTTALTAKAVGTAKEIHFRTDVV